MSRQVSDGSVETQAEPIGDASTGRDDRIDLLRGLALISILFDHIPGNSLSSLTFQSLGFCDAAEIFVFLAGYSATIAYGRVLERQGAKAFLRKVGLRCARLYTTHVGLLLATLLIVVLRNASVGTSVSPIEPILNDGVAGILRGLSLRTLPVYLDILPLYIILLAVFPAIYYCMRRGVTLTLLFSFTVYYISNIFHINLPNQTTPSTIDSWTFNPFAWQFIYVLGAVFASEYRRGNRLFSKSHGLPRMLCTIYILLAMLYVRCGGFALGSMMIDDLSTPFLGNEPKSFEAPWRILNVLALAYLALTSSGLSTLARSAILKPILSSGRHSLPIFVAICILSLLGRILFERIGNGPLAQFCVNTASVSVLVWLAVELDRQRRQNVPSVSAATLTLP